MSYLVVIKEVRDCGLRFKGLKAKKTVALMYFKVKKYRIRYLEIRKQEAILIK